MYIIYTHICITYTIYVIVFICIISIHTNIYLLHISNNQIITCIGIHMHMYDIYIYIMPNKLNLIVNLQNIARYKQLLLSQCIISWIITLNTGWVLISDNMIGLNIKLYCIKTSDIVKMKYSNTECQ